MNNTQGFSDGCHSEWVKTNFFTSGERNIGSFPNRASCVQAVLTECPDHDLANVPTSCEHGGECSSCWCQHSGGELVAAHQQTSGWLTCRAKALNTTNTTADAPADTMEAESEQDGCFGDWVPTNAFSNGEFYTGRFDTNAACVAQAKTNPDCEGFDLINVE